MVQEVTDPDLISQLESAHQNAEGFKGVGEDILSSIQSSPDALYEFLQSIPQTAKGAGQYVVSHTPLETLARMGTGGTESVLGVASAPRKLMRYVMEKFPQYAEIMKKAGHDIDAPTLLERFRGLEEKTGMLPKTADEQAIQSMGGLLFGGKALSKLPGAKSRIAALTAEQGGEGEDPLHAALLGMLGEGLGASSAKGINRLAKSEGQPDLVQRQPGSKELVANMQKAPEGSPYITAVSNIPAAATNFLKMAKEFPGKVAESPKSVSRASARGTGSLLQNVAAIPGAKRVPYLGEGMDLLGSYLKHLGTDPEKAARKYIFGDIEKEQLPEIKERLDASKRLGWTHYSPGEATGNPFESAKEGNVGITSAGSKKLYKAGRLRAESEEASIDRLLDQIHDGSPLKGEARKIYEQVGKEELPPEFIDKYKSLPVIQEAIGLIKKRPSYKQMMAGVPENTFEYWDNIKRVLYDVGEKSKGARGKEKHGASVYTDTRKRMVSDMDKINSDYPRARALSERDKTRIGLEEYFDKRQKNALNIKKLLSSKKAFDDLMYRTRDLPEANQTIRDLKVASENAIAHDPSTRAAAALERTGMTKARNQLDAMKRDLAERHGKKHDTALVDLITSDKWMNELKKYLR